VKLIERRIGLLFAVFLGLLMIAALRAAWFGSIRSDALQKRGAVQSVSDVTVTAERGTIRDRNGVELAVSEMTSSVAATPYLFKDPLKAAEKIAPILGQKPNDVLAKLSKKNTGFVYLARKIPTSKAEQLSKLHLDGLQFIPEAKRVYPRGWLASQLLGTVGTDNTGLSGMEYTREKALHGRDGERRVVRDALGQPISLREVLATRPGEDVTLTLDAAIQDRTEAVLQQVGQLYHPRGATAVVMDPRDGAILALANWPRVDANNVGESPAYARQDRAVGFTYEPGSTFKAFTVAGAIQEGRVTPHTTFGLPPKLQIADRVIGEAHDRGFETMTTSEILQKSSNIGAIKIGERLGSRDFANWVSRFGFGKTTGVDISGEERGIVPTLQHYSGSSMGNLPIGQGLAVTPMQMATAYSAIANGGVLRPPHVIQGIGAHAAPTPAGRRVISASTAASVRTMLEGVLAAGGTASEATIPGYVLAGKTGTANKPDPINGGYSKDKYVASFVGFAPAKDPKLLVSVMVDEPQGIIYGGQVAAPASQKIMAFALPYLRIPPT
jgi:cell division protein FtsI (penicillin-binding protein 3)